MAACRVLCVSRMLFNWDRLWMCVLNCNFSKEQNMLSEDDCVIETCRSVLNVLMWILDFLNNTECVSIIGEFCKTIFSQIPNRNIWCYYHWKRNVCSSIVTLNAFDVRPTCDTADVQAILPFPPNPLKHVLCDVPDCGVDALSQFW